MTRAATIRAVPVEPQTEAVSSVSLTLPCPPSTNELWRNRPGGRVRTRVYDDWRGHAGWRLREQRPGCVAGSVLVMISVERGSAAADIDNRIKALLDLLVEHKVIEDDKHVVGLCAAWAPPAAKMARIKIMRADTYDFTFQLASDGQHGGWFISAPNPNRRTFDGT